jgi:hypothetical protein
VCVSGVVDEQRCVMRWTHAKQCFGPIRTFIFICLIHKASGDSSRPIPTMSSPSGFRESSKVSLFVAPWLLLTDVVTTAASHSSFSPLLNAAPVWMLCLRVERVVGGVVRASLGRRTGSMVVQGHPYPNRS